ncbi:MAG: hypothetical protein F6K30_31295 [Cyanothece sp. SIO2G6]|nr:hypothetical protein [Cyanothece sp. SIO2G6]
MYYLCVPGLGYVHKRWKSDEPRFCKDVTKAKNWKLSTSAIQFRERELSQCVHIPWELWQEVDEELIPIIRPRLT